MKGPDPPRLRGWQALSVKGFAGASISQAAALTEWLKAANIRDLTVSPVWRPRIRCLRAELSLKAQGKDSSLPRLTSGVAGVRGGAGLAATSLPSAPTWPPLPCVSALCLNLCLLSHKDASHWIWGPTLTHLNLITHAKTHFQIRYIHRHGVLGLEHIFWGSRFSP